MNSEIKSKKWLFAGLGLQFLIAYVLSFIVYQLGTLITEGSLGTAFVPGLIIVAVIVLIFTFLSISSSARVAKESASKPKKMAVK